MGPGARLYLSPRITYIFQVLKTKKSQLRAEILMASSVVYAGRWRVENNFSHSSRVSKPRLSPSPGTECHSAQGWERGWPSAIIWNQHERHCPPFVFQASLWGLSLEVFVLSLLYSDYSWKPKWDFSLYWTTVKVKEFQLKLMVFLLQKGISWQGFAPRSWQVHPFVSPHHYLIASKPCSESSHTPTAT